LSTALLSIFLLICAPALAGPKQDALAAYQKFFDAFTTDNHDQMVRLFAPDALKRGDRWLIVQFHNSPTPKPAP
jgi:hypothetical protein